MKKIILSAALFVITNFAFASEWYFLIGETSDRAVFFDKESAVREGHTLTMWVRHIALSESKLLAANVFSYTTKVKYDCTKKTATILGGVAYNKKRETVNQIKQLEEQGIVPDTIGEALFKIACVKSFPNSLPPNSAIPLSMIDTDAFAAEIAEQRNIRSPLKN